ncbi:enoyl-CoA hydratase/isomerase family protein [Caulobacter sp. S45]|uniref:enoyl-CoA hydratase/isomerase family protein n=1 Tax=Caulobacter sp. S45 TaxID=1641861 RepID=UPI001576F0A5|nr:enoyl-CoA hydratase/isomerase family protein [Caulobacter sp. S45]
MTDAAPVIARVEGGWGRLTLNRPSALHALNTQMCQIMAQALLAWRNDPRVAAVMLDHTGPRGFCAGGDIRMIMESGAQDGVAARAFFAEEYRLNALLFGYDKPVVAFMDGVVMGGGVGISAPASYRIATERTVFAMPETGIGLFPDVGGGWFLPRLVGETGMWLALTGARLKAADCLLLGLATDYVPQGQVEALKAQLLADPGALDTLLTEREADAGEPPLARQRADIDRLFGAESVEAILNALEADGGEWALAQLATLKSKSPQAMKVAYRQLRQGRDVQSFEAEMAVEYRIAARVSMSADFREGVRAVIVDKDNAPRWDPPTLAQVTQQKLDAIFEPLPEDEEWTPAHLNEGGAQRGRR